MEILDIKFKSHGQSGFFKGFEGAKPGDTLILETEQGLRIGRVVAVYEEIPPGVDEALQGNALRLATEEDLLRSAENGRMASEVAAFCRGCIQNRKLDMKLVDVEVYFDRSKIIFFFTAPARIDFRDLVKDLVREYRARIELRQIGVRHETQMVGAVGNCGSVCCCRKFLRSFAPVTIKMAKEQNLFLNPAKISGICGRLLCCLSFEQENYDTFHRNCPKLGKKYSTTKGNMKVLRGNIFRNSINVLNDQGEEIELTLDEWKAINPRRPESSAPQGGKQEKQDNKGKNGAYPELMTICYSPDALDEQELSDLKNLEDG